MTFFFFSLHFDSFFPHPGFMPAPFPAPPGQNSSQGKQWMAAHQLLSPARGVKKRPSWGEICLNTVLCPDLKLMPLLSCLQKALSKIYLKNSQQASVGSWGWEAIPGNTKLPFLAPLCLWFGWDKVLQRRSLPLTCSVICKTQLFPIILHIRNCSSWEQAKFRPSLYHCKFRVTFFASVGLFALCPCETM